jgi:hypothetical protein
VRLDWLLLECGCAQEDIYLNRDRGSGVHVPGAGTESAETAGESKRPECVFPVCGGATGNFDGAGAHSKAAFVQPGF